MLVSSCARDAGLTPRGGKVMRAMLRGALAARLVSEAAWQAHPEYAQVRIDRPLFVTGLPRTGTTALHRLLTADPAHQGLKLWLAEVPQPRPPRATWAADPVFQYIQAGCERHHAEHPEFMGVHYMAADQVEECWQLLRQSMRSVSWECLAHLPSYSAWLRGQDWTGPYRRHRRNLQLIGLPDAGRRWVLKNPSHLFALDALLRVYPDALVVQTHREPSTAIASVCSLAAQASAGWSTTFTGEVIGRDQLELWASGLERFSAERARHDPARFFDVHYDDLVADPVGTAEAVYAHFGLPFSGVAADAMRALAAHNTARSAHRYTLADFGLTAADVGARFGALGRTPLGCDNHMVSTTREGGPARSGRRADVVQLAGELFAQKGYRATTVREIADAAGILSGSLYHHFDSKESIGDEILSGFINDVLADYRAAVASGGSPRAVLEQIVRSTSQTLCPAPGRPGHAAERLELLQHPAPVRLPAQGAGRDRADLGHAARARPGIRRLPRGPGRAAHLPAAPGRAVDPGPVAPGGGLQHRTGGGGDAAAGLRRHHELARRRHEDERNARRSSWPGRSCSRR